MVDKNYYTKPNIYWNKGDQYMISTVTTTTTTTTVAATTTTTAAATASTVTTVAGTPLVAQLGMIAVISLIVLLIIKELSGAYSAQMNENGTISMPASKLESVLNTGIVPLLFAFGSIVIVKILQIIG